MIQFYFLSISLNIIGGLALCADAPLKGGPAFAGLRTFLRDRTVRLVIAILACVTGGLKFVTAMRGDIPVVGDFLPAVAGIAVGGTMLLELYSSETWASSEPGEAERTAPPPRKVSGFESFLLSNKESIGIAGILAGLLHFLFPMVIFL